MIKLAALNEESHESSGPEEEEVTREALEQIAIAQYTKALELQRTGEKGVEDALVLLKDLVDTELLYGVKKPENGEKTTNPLFNLKYLCYKNIASIQASLGKKEEAIESYCEASALDDTDVSLWYRLGNLCLQSDKFEMALEAFQRGTKCNPKHWPCIDKIITLLLGLGHYNECIRAIFDALNLDPDYFRGLAYRKFIYTEYPYVLEYMSYISTEYNWVPGQDKVDDAEAELLLKEAKDINVKHIEQVRETTFSYTLPELKLQKPISKLTWVSVGESLVHMHHYMTENCYTHASKLELIYENEKLEENMEVCLEKTESKEVNSNEIMEVDPVEDATGNDKNYTEKLSPDKKENEKAESESENANVTTENKENRDQKKTAIRRRGSALSFLEQWEWCTKRRSSRKKPQTKQDRADENIYETLRRLIPISLTHVAQQNNEKPERLDDSPDTMDLYKLFEEKQESDAKANNNESDDIYFDSSSETDNVSDFITKFKDGQYDIIEILRQYLMILSSKWKYKWSSKLLTVFVEANKCFSQHFGIPNYSEDDVEDVRMFALVNLMSEEITINQRLTGNSDCKEVHNMGIIEAVGVVMNKPQILQEHSMETVLRYVWLKFHCYLFNKSNECALDCLYQLLYEFKAMGEQEDLFYLKNLNFTFKPIISKAETLSLIKSHERNKRLSTVLTLYELGNVEEALSIILDSFEYCKNIARKQEYKEMSLDFAVQLSLILECFWDLEKPEECFKWSLTCLHEGLKHYLLCSLGSIEFEKWSLVVVKSLLCMEHCLKVEGTMLLDLLSEKEISQVIEDIIQIIGHQVDDTNGSDMPLNTVVPWIILHYILQREEDQGRFQKPTDVEKSIIASDDIPNPLMILFVAHEYLGSKSWCMDEEGKLLYFILDTIIPRLRAPLLSKCLELICQHLEQCVFCIFGHPSKKTKLRYLIDHNVTPHKLNWERAQQVYEIFRPLELPEIEGKLPSITGETEQLFQRMISLMPSDLKPKNHVTQVLDYMEAKTVELPSMPGLLPFKMRELYFLLGDYYFKKDERSKSMKYNLYDILINNDRFESWAEIALAKATNLEVTLNSLANIKDMDYLKDASVAIKCFQQALKLDSMHCNLWIEYGVFVYGLHSFCSRLLKQASESMSMEDFESLELKKDEMLNEAQKCFKTVSQDLNSSDAQEDENDEFWLHYYMLGKIAEKRNLLPKEYLNHYLKAAKHLEDNNATYPLKINYNSPQQLSIEALEIQYRIHASILKFIERHENRVILQSDGKVFFDCLEKCANGPFSTKKKEKKDTDEFDTNTCKVVETNKTTKVETPQTTPQPQQVSTAYKRSISDSGEDIGTEAKKQKIEVAAKIRRAASYDAECQAVKDSLDPKDSALDVLLKAAMIHSHVKINDSEEKQKNDTQVETDQNNKSNTGIIDTTDTNTDNLQTDTKETVTSLKTISKKGETTSNSDSSSSSSDSSSDDSSSDSSSSSNTDSTVKSNNESKPLSEEDRVKLTSMCLDALEDCVSRFPQHYKALYRLAHYHFYSKTGKDVEKCRDLMLGYFISRNNQKLPGLFCERKNNNFFNAIWKIPSNDVDRAGSFGSHMSRCVLLSMQILKEIDDHKSLLELNMQLSKIPEQDKKYLRDSEREEFAQQALSLCIQSLKGQLTKFSQQADLKTNETERQALNSLMLDIYRAYQKVQKQPCSKQFTSLLVEGFKLINLVPLSENVNLVDLSMRHCQALIASLKQQATMASINSANAKKTLTKSFESIKVQQSQTSQAQNACKSTQPDTKVSQATAVVPTHDVSVTFPSYMPIMNNSLAQQTTAALSLLNMTTNLGGHSIQGSLSQINSFQSEYYNQLLSSFAASYSLVGKKPTSTNQNRTTKPTNAVGKVQKAKMSAKSFPGSSPNFKSSEQSKLSTAHVTSVITSSIPSSTIISSNAVSVSKSMSAPVYSNVLPKISAATSFGLTTQPAHQSVISTLSSGTSTSGTAKPAHMNATSTVSAAIHTKPPSPHLQVSPGKTLQEKLAERQKSITDGSTSEISSISNVPSNQGQEFKNISNGKKHETSIASMSNSEVIVLDDDS